MMMFRRNKSSNKKTTVKSTTTCTVKEEQLTTMQTINPVDPVVEEQEEEDPWSEENFLAVAEQYNLTEVQQEALMEMQDRLADVNHWKNDPFEVIRFLKECKYNTKAAEDKFRKMVHWRMENNIDNYLETYGEPHALFDYFPSVVLKGVDYENDPIFVERSGAFDAFGFYKHFGTQAMVDFVTYKREQDITRRPNKAQCWQRDYYEPTYGKRVGQFTAIIDVDGLNRNHMRAGLLPLLNQIARLTQDNYAGVAKRIIVTRAPSIFKVMWSLIKNFFDPCIREIVTFTTHEDYLHVLEQYLDRTVLPPEMNPIDGRGDLMPGFENVNLAGGLLTKDLIAKYKGNNNKGYASDITETTMSFSDVSSTLSSSDDENSVQGVYNTMTEGVRVVSAGLLGGGTFRGETIYLSEN